VPGITSKRMRSLVGSLGVALLGLYAAASGFLVKANAKAGSFAGEQLGHVNFPNSCKAEAQPALLKGLALLHSFQYRESEGAFKAAADLDANCAMAQWGKAMALYHQLWDFPQRHTLQRGLEDVQQAQQIAAPSARERGYIAAAAAFYNGDEKLSHVQRTTAYSQALERLHTEAPDDVDASAFYALSLVALADENADVMANRKKAIAILEPLFRAHPDHPGVAHYLIHAADRPGLAEQGLAAARAYAKIAPDSSHALHMPSHIFTRLGLWQESIASNIAASASAAHASEMHEAESHYQTHAMDFLDYAYLQSGLESKARALATEEMNVPGSDEEERAQHRAATEARNAIELHRWKEAAEVAVPPGHETSQDTTYWARAIGAARSGDVEAAKGAAKKLAEIVAMREGESKATGYEGSGGKATDLGEAEAWLAFAQGDGARAIDLMRAVADREDAKGVDSTTMPAREMLADMLLELKRPGEAVKSYEATLVESPNRFDSLWGAARASELAGDTHSARRYYAKLAEVTDPAAERAELREARHHLASAD
jgi:tetratricopeptide (TPR) repeat protein